MTMTILLINWIALQGNDKKGDVIKSTQNNFGRKHEKGRITMKSEVGDFRLK